MCSSRNEHAPLKLDQLSTFSFLKSQFCRRFFLFTFRPRPRLIIISRFVTLSRFSLLVDDSGGRVSSKFRHGYKKKKKKKRKERYRNEDEKDFTSLYETNGYILGAVIRQYASVYHYARDLIENV